MNKKKAMALPITLFTLAMLMVVAFSISRVTVLQEERLTALENGITPFGSSDSNNLFTDSDGVQLLSDLENPLELPEFQESQDNASFEKDKVLDLTSYSEYAINTLEFDKDSTLKLGAGEYWIKELSVKKNFNINVVVEEEGTAKLFVEKLTMAKDSRLNYPDNASELDAGKLIIIVYGDVSFDSAKICGGIYSKGDLTLEDSTVYGAVVAKTFSQGVDYVRQQVIYDEDVLQTLLDLDY